MNDYEKSMFSFHVKCNGSDWGGVINWLVPIDRKKIWTKCLHWLSLEWNEADSPVNECPSGLWKWDEDMTQTKGYWLKLQACRKRSRRRRSGTTLHGASAFLNSFFLLFSHFKTNCYVLSWFLGCQWTENGALKKLTASGWIVVVILLRTGLAEK